MDKEKIKKIVEEALKNHDDATLNYVSNMLETGGISFVTRINATKMYLKKNICSKCRKEGETIVHHIIPVRVRPDLYDDLENMTELCKKCHVEEEKKCLIANPTLSINDFITPELQHIHLDNVRWR